MNPTKAAIDALRIARDRITESIDETTEDFPSVAGANRIAAMERLIEQIDRIEDALEVIDR